VLRHDIARERELLLEEDRKYAKLEGDLAILENDLARLKSNSKLAYDEEKRSLDRLETRKTQTIDLLDQSKKREAILLNQLDDLSLRI
jgi:septal ring factor EnvC (AmiA/AmiB activator)